MNFGESGDSIKLNLGTHRRLNTTGSRKSFRDESGAASIPSQYQTIVIDKSEKPGFSSRSKRFDDYNYVTDAPGPGAYSSIDKSNICRTVSDSKKGSGGFASKSRRKNVFGVIGDIPGPGAYECFKLSPQSFMSKNDFNRAPYSATFAQPIATNSSYDPQRGTSNPSPNSYETRTSLLTNGGGAKAAFKSTSKRIALFDQSTGGCDVPSPSQYNVKIDYTKPNSHVPLSSFKSSVKRNFSAPSDIVPGPGSYEPYEKPDLSDIKRIQMPKKHYLCISAPAMPVTKPPPQPGPGAYDLPSDFSENKKYIQSSFFLSTTGRSKTPDGRGRPGPTTYKPQLGQKQSFMYNAKGVWVA